MDSDQSNCPIRVRIMNWIFTFTGLYLAYAVCRGYWRRRKMKSYIREAIKPGAGLEM